MSELITQRPVKGLLVMADIVTGAFIVMGIRTPASEQHPDGQHRGLVVSYPVFEGQDEKVIEQEFLEVLKQPPFNVDLSKGKVVYFMKA